MSTESPRRAPTIEGLVRSLDDIIESLDMQRHAIHQTHETDLVAPEAVVAFELAREALSQLKTDITKVVRSQRPPRPKKSKPAPGSPQASMENAVAERKKRNSWIKRY